MGFLKNIITRRFSKFIDPSYFTLLRLIVLTAIKPKNQKGKIKLNGLKIEYNDIKALMGMYHEIFYKKHYQFKTNNVTPVIIDCGANIGLSVLYFHKLYPKAKIIAIEADPTVASILENNLKRNNCEAEIIQKAAWSNSDTLLNFGQAGADAGSIFATENIVQVPTIRFKDVLQKYQAIDLIKIDIEGAELEVIEDASDELHRADYLFIEFHSFPNRPQKLENILDLASKQGFRYKILQARHEEIPFLQNIQQQEMDVQLNIFFSKGNSF